VAAALSCRTRSTPPAHGVRHHHAAYFIEPLDNHREEIRRWGYGDEQERRFRQLFGEHLAKEFPTETWSAGLKLAAPVTRGTAFREWSAYESYPFDDAAKAALAASRRRYFQLRPGLNAWLGSKLLAFGLADLRGDAEVAKKLGPLTEALARDPRGYDASLDETCEKTEIDVPRAGAPEPAFSPNGVLALETARALAQVTADDGRIGVDHLLAALASEIVRGSHNILDEWLDVERLRQELLARADDATRAAWVELLYRPHN
jgi:hypothetical protein